MGSIADIPVTDETRAALVAAGVSECPDSELSAQALLALTGEVGADERPSCFGRAFDPTSAKCGGCIVMPHCWGKDGAYLRRLAAGAVIPPPSVPASTIASAIAATPRLPPPPPLPH